MLSVLVVTDRIHDLVGELLKSVAPLDPQIIIQVETHGRKPLGVRKNNLLKLAAYEWVLLLDTDERVSPKLAREIEDVVKSSPKDISGYRIPYQNFAFGKQVTHGGERYSKVRLFRASAARITPDTVHEEVVVEGKVGKLQGTIRHVSYRTLPQVLSKFTGYAWDLASTKRRAHERLSFAKLFMYGPHMVWARIAKDNAWRDGWPGVLLACCFGYMETLTYWLLACMNLVSFVLPRAHEPTHTSH